MIRTLHAVPLLLLVAACAGEDNAPQPVDPHATAAETGHEGHDHGPGEHGAGGTGSTAAPQEGAVSTRAPGTPLVFAIQEGWIEEPPANSMRQAQYRLPAADGDSADAEVIVSYFGEAGAGPLDANIARWCGSFSQPDGSDTRERMVMSNRRVNGIAITEYDIRGTFLGMRGTESSDGYRMVVAVVESDHGPYFLKVTGPEATVERWLASFRSFTGSGCA